MLDLAELKTNRIDQKLDHVEFTMEFVSEASPSPSPSPHLVTIGIIAFNHIRLKTAVVLFIRPRPRRLEIVELNDYSTSNVSVTKQVRLRRAP
jgi:hypothetical protein